MKYSMIAGNPEGDPKDFNANAFKRQVVVYTAIVFLFFNVTAGVIFGMFFFQAMHVPRETVEYFFDAFKVLIKSDVWIIGVGMGAVTANKISNDVAEAKMMAIKYKMQADETRTETVAGKPAK